jgi:NADH-quinone oxidoreductase subunit J
MTVPFAIIAILTIASAVAAMTLRNLVHCALSVAVTFAGLAALYLQLNAQFVGFAQILVYIGAVSILIVFAILLTRGSEPPLHSIFSSSWVAGVGVAVVVFILLSAAIAGSFIIKRAEPKEPEASVLQIGQQLMTKYILPLEVIGLLLTAALIGAVILAMHEKEPKSESPKQISS